MYGPGEFEVDVQELATDLRYAEVGDGISAYQRTLALDISDYINAQRDSVTADYLEQPNDFLAEMQAKIANGRREYSISFDKTVLPGMAAIESDIRADIDRRRQIGMWLGAILPKRSSTQVSSRKVYQTLITHPELAFQDKDIDEAEAILAEQAVVRAAEKQAEFRPLEGERLFKLSDNLFQIMLEAARTGLPKSKIEIYQSDEFRRLVTNGHKPNKEQIRQAFNDAWEIINATFSDYDVDYQLFEETGETKARRYLIVEPDIAEVVWSSGNDQAVELQPDAQEEQKFRGLVTGIQGSVIMFENGDPIRLETDVQHLVARKLFDLGKNAFIGSTRLVQETATELSLSRTVVESDVRNLLSKLGSNYLERQFSSKKNKLMIRLSPGSRS